MTQRSNAQHLSAGDITTDTLVRFQAVSQLAVIGSPIGQCTIGPAASGLDPSCLSLQYICCSSLCVGGLGSVCYIWSTSPVLLGVLCEFKCALSNSLFLSFFLSLGGPEPKNHASGLPGMMTHCCPQSTLPCCCSSFNSRSGRDTLNDRL